jgi:Ca-activated chloride channel family protein
MVLGSIASQARADGLLMTGKTLAHPVRTAVRVDVIEEVATTSAEFDFPSFTGADKRFLFPVPETASVVGFSVFRNGQWEAAEMTGAPATTPGQVSTEPTGSQMTAEVQSYLGGNAFVISLPGEDDTLPLRIKLDYIQIIAYEFGEVSYAYPLTDFPGSSGGARAEFALSVDVSSVRTISGYAAPGYESMGTLKDKTNGHLAIQYQATNFTPPTDFSFSYGVVQDAQLYVNLLTDHEQCGQDGFFLLVVEPKQETTEAQAIPKYFSFVMDNSGSMAGYKIEQAKDAARYFVDNLNQQDRFNVISFNAAVSALFPSPQGVSAASQSQAVTFIDSKYADSMTNLNQAMLTALSSDFDPTFARILVLLTDGEPTDGVTDPAAIIQNVKVANKSHTRIFTFGIGAGVNNSLLTSLATGNNGEARFLSEHDQISQVLSGFYKKIDRPVLTDVTIDYGGVPVYDTYPGGMTDLYAGTALLVIGRYSLGGDVEGQLSGSMMGNPEAYSFPLSFPECAKGANAFLPRLWAKSKIDALIAKMSEQGYADAATVELIKGLGTRYGIQTPYSSYEMGTASGTGGSAGFGGSTGSSGRGGSYGATSDSHGYSGGGLELSGCQTRSGITSSTIPFGLMGLGLLVAMRRSSRRGRR